MSLMSHGRFLVELWNKYIFYCSDVYFSIKTFSALSNDESVITFINGVDINFILIDWLIFEFE